MKKSSILSVLLLLSLILCISLCLYIKESFVEKEEIDNIIEEHLITADKNLSISNEDIQRIADAIVIELESEQFNKQHDSECNQEIVELFNKILLKENVINNNDYDYHHDTITNIYNSYIENSDIKESVEDDGNNTKDIDNYLKLSEDVIYEIGTLINIEADEDEEYVYSLRMYTENVVLVFPNYVDINAISVNLYANFDKTGKEILEVEDGMFVSSEPLDGIYYIEIKGLPIGHHEIRVGY